MFPAFGRYYIQYGTKQEAVMSKGQRKRGQNAEKEKERLEREEFEAKKKKVRRVTAIVTCSLIGLLIVGCIVGGILYNVRMDRGDYLRREIAASSANIDVNGAMMNYFLNDVYNTFVDNYGSYVSYFGLNTSISLKKQEVSEGETWFEYLMSGAEDSVEITLRRCELAAAEEMTLTEGERSALAVRAEWMDEGLYGRGTQKSDLLDAKSLEALSLKYYFEKTSQLTPSDAEIEAAYRKDPRAYQYVDYDSFNVYYNDESIPAAEAKAQAKKIAGAKTADEFRALVKAQLLEENPVMTDGEIENELETLPTAGAMYIEGNEFSEWAFGAKTGDTKVIEDANNQLFIVYRLTKEARRSEDRTVNFRHILLSNATYRDSAKAEELLAQFLAGEKTEEAFGLLALAWSEDEGSYYHGGLYEYVHEGMMVPEIDDWCFDPSRKPGEVSVIETEYGWHVMYYVGEGLPRWKAQIAERLSADAFDSFYESKKADYPVSFDPAVLNRIPG